jgi:hypothetical protein
MANKTKTRSELKLYFVKNAIPTEGNFAELIDAQLNQADDGVFKPGGEPLSVVAAPGDQKRTLRLYGAYPAANPDWLISLNPQNPAAPATNQAGFGIADGAGTTRLMLDPAGNLTVTGGVTYTGQLSKLDVKDVFTAIVRAADFLIGHSSRRGTPGRALVDAKDALHLNYGKDWPQTVIGSSLVVSDTLDVRLPGGTGAWNRFVVNTTSAWGDGASQYVTIGAGGAAGIMFWNPHVTWMAAENRASIRYGRTGGTAGNTWWDAGVRADGAFSFNANDNAGIGETLKITKTGFTSTKGIAVNDGQNTGVGRGVWLWSPSDSNHVLYSATPATGKSPAGANAVAGFLDSNHRMRFRTSTGQGFLFENSSEVALVDIDSDDGRLWTKGAIYAGSSDLYFSETNHNHTGWGNTTGWAAIENAANYGALMILGRQTAAGRIVKLWDVLEVYGELRIRFGAGYWVFQGDGNLVKYRNDGAVLWALNKVSGHAGW